MTQMPQETQPQPFSLSPNLLHLLVQQQATSLERAIAECVMNSVDAGAKQVHVHTNRDRKRRLLQIVVRDDGRGLTSQDEIDRYFATFGFDHHSESERGRRQYGAFGMGRAALWAYARTTWRTGTFELSVDVRADGVAFRSTGDLAHQPGLSIHATLYDPDPDDLAGLATHLRYVKVPVYLDGAPISSDPAQERWTHQDEHAYYRVQTSGPTSVYNLGVLVEDHTAGQHGSGVIVTKRALDLNLTRTHKIGRDTAWKQVMATFRRLCLDRLVHKARLTEDQKWALAQAWLRGEVDWAGVQNAKLISLFGDRELSLMELAHQLERTPKVTSASGMQDLLHDRVAQSGLALVLTGATLNRFGVHSSRALRDRLREQLVSPSVPLAHRQLFAQLLGDAQSTWSDDLDDLLSVAEIDAMFTKTNLAPEQWTTREQLLVLALEEQLPTLGEELFQGGPLRRPQRSLVIGEAISGVAWTDGHSYIALNRPAVGLAEFGFSGMTTLALVLLHELTHDQGNLGSDVHDSAFYTQFHDTALRAAIGRAAGSALHRYADLCLRHGLVLSPGLLSDAGLNHHLVNLPTLLLGPQENVGYRHLSWEGRVFEPTGQVHGLGKDHDEVWLVGELWGNDGTHLGRTPLKPAYDRTWIAQPLSKNRQTEEPGEAAQLPKATLKRIGALMDGCASRPELWTGATQNGLGDRFMVFMTGTDASGERRTRVLSRALTYDEASAYQQAAEALCLERWPVAAQPAGPVTVGALLGTPRAVYPATPGLDAELVKLMAFHHWLTETAVTVGVALPWHAPRLAQLARDVASLARDAAHGLDRDVLDQPLESLLSRSLPDLLQAVAGRLGHLCTLAGCDGYGNRQERGAVLQRLALNLAACAAHLASQGQSGTQTEALAALRAPSLNGAHL